MNQQKPLSDDELIASGKRSAYKLDCTSVIIARPAESWSSSRPEGRNYYLCDMGTKPHDTHHNGPDSWYIDEDGNWKHEGETLTDVNFQGANP